MLYDKFPLWLSPQKYECYNLASMCGRYALWDLRQLQLEKQVRSYKRFNIAPGQSAPVITQKGLFFMKWGLIPHWSKEFKVKFSTFNARSETLLDSRIYGPLTKNKRALIPANAFYEWTKKGKEKFPFLIKLDNRELFNFAGLYDVWYDAEGKEFKTYTIITCSPNKFIESIHDRMPVIINKEDEDDWLGEFDERLLIPTDEKMEAWQVSDKVNKPNNDDQNIIEPVSDKTIS